MKSLILGSYRNPFHTSSKSAMLLSFAELKFLGFCILWDRYAFKQGPQMSTHSFINETVITDTELRVAWETIYLTYIFETSVICITLHLNTTNTDKSFAVKNIKTTKNFKSSLYLLQECRGKRKKLKGSVSIYFSRLKMLQ